MNWIKKLVGIEETKVEIKHSNRLQLQKGAIPTSYKEYWFLSDGVILTSEPDESENAFYCVATSLALATIQYKNWLEA